MLWETHPGNLSTHRHTLDKYMCTPAHIHRKKQKYPLAAGDGVKYAEQCALRKPRCKKRKKKNTRIKKKRPQRERQHRLSKEKQKGESYHMLLQQ